MTQSWSIIIFIYNEEHSISSVINSSLKVLQKLAPDNHELIIVNDGSTDQTEMLINKSIAGHKNIKIITHDKNLGIGKALLSGYQVSQFENICAIPGDGQFDPEELIPFKNTLEKTVISFYRTQRIRYTLFRKLLSFANKIMNRFFLKIKIQDVNWVKVYKKGVFDNIKPVLSSSLVESELCAKVIRMHYNIIEVESVYHPRIGGKSKGASLKTMLLAIKELYKLYFNLKRSSRSCH